MIFWLIQFIPLIASGIILLLLQKRHSLSTAISVLASFVNVGLAFYVFKKGIPTPQPATWLEIGLFQIQFGFVFDNLAKLMLLIVTGVGAIIHLFSVGYMEGDSGKARYFGFLSFFMFSMIGIVLAANFIQMFVFWELVGLSSYLLIGFWYDRDSAAQAGKKAYLTNKIGDFGFMLGILCVWVMAGTLDFSKLATLQQWQPVQFNTVTITLTLTALLIFCGAVGKSAQFPLHVWLPDAMEGPTPVSALIHAATMVAAGVYMLSRVYFLISGSALAMSVIAWIGGITAFMSALIAVQQNDIKRILAYSTLSQLGYMVMVTGIQGVQNYAPGMFHLSTHAFFKALLFLSAGSIIIALHHEQNIWKMGGLAKKMSVTFVTFLIGAFALMGFPGFSGFFSKEMILTALYENNRLLFALGLATAFLTAFYMTRLLVVVFFGLPRGQSAMHAKESRLVMTVPLVLLAVLSLIGGCDFFGIMTLLPKISSPENHHVVAASLLVFCGGSVLSALIYWNRVNEPIYLTLLRQKFYIDELYGYFIRSIQGTFATLLNFLDRWMLDLFFFRGLAASLRGIGWGLLRLQTGNVQTYAFFLGVGVVVLIGWVLLT